MTKTMQTKQGSGYTTDEGQVVPTHTLYRFVDTDDARDVRNATWRSTIASAEKSWEIRHG